MQLQEAAEPPIEAAEIDQTRRKTVSGLDIDFWILAGTRVPRDLCAECFTGSRLLSVLSHEPTVQATVQTIQRMKNNLPILEFSKHAS